jgi:hypothetical protein
MSLRLNANALAISGSNLVATTRDRVGGTFLIAGLTAVCDTYFRYNAAPITINESKH